jgi:LysR family transcriptional regulator (chromosome initiation inhibitor)
LPSTRAFLDAALAGVGWGMNPSLLAEPHLASGELVQLGADAVLDVALYWQVSRLEVPVLEQLTRSVIRAATSALEQD